MPKIISGSGETQGAGGNVGIGIPLNPNAPLHIKPPSGTDTQEGLRLEDPNSGSLEGLYIRWDSSGKEDQARIGQVSDPVGSGSDLYFSTNATDSGAPTERARIDATGAVGVGTSSIDASALLELSSTTRGFLPPRMTTVQRDAISSPANGLLIFNTTTNVLNYYQTGSGWRAISAGGAPIDFNVEGPYTVGGATQNGVVTHRVTIAGTLSSATLMTKEAGTAGSLTVDIKRSTDAGATWISIFQTLPTVAFSAGNYATNNGTLLSAGVTLSVGDLLRLDITSVQTGGVGFALQLFYS